MAGTYINISATDVGSGGGVFYYPTFANFPATGADDTLYVDESSSIVYWWDISGPNYEPLVASFTSSSVDDTDSLDLGLSLGKIVGNVRLSTDAATSGYLKVTNTIHGTPNFGLHSEIAVGSLSETTSSVLTITGGTGACLGSGTTIQVKQADPITSGYLSSADWNTFNSKEPAVTKGNLTETTSSVLTVTGGTGSVIGTGTTIEVKQAATAQSGYLSSTDWNTFNGKQNALTIGNLSEVTSSVLTLTGGTGAIIGSGLTIEVKQAATAQSGYLSSTDWNTFNSKEPTVTKGNLSEATSSILTITGGTGSVIGTGTTIEVKQAATAQSGYLSSTDWNTFNGKQAGDSDLTAISGLTTPGIACKTTTDPTSPVWAVRTITGTTNRLSVSNGDGASGNPTLNVDTSLLPSPVTGDIGKTLVATAADVAAWTTLSTGASNVSTVVTDFNNILSASDTDVQKALDTIDNITLASIGGITDGSSSTAGKVGEIISSTVSSASATGIGSSNQWGDVTSITLSAGVWDIRGIVGFNENGATLTTGVSGGIKSTSGNSAPAFGDYVTYNNLISSTSDLIAPIASIEANISGSTTFYLKSLFTYSAGAPKHYGKIWAKRTR